MKRREFPGLSPYDPAVRELTDAFGFEGFGRFMAVWEHCWTFDVAELDTGLLVNLARFNRRGATTALPMFQKTLLKVWGKFGKSFKELWTKFDQTFGQLPPNNDQSLRKVSPNNSKTSTKVLQNIDQSLPKLEGSNPRGSIIDNNKASRDIVNKASSKNLKLGDADAPIFAEAEKKPPADQSAIFVADATAPRFEKFDSDGRRGDPVEGSDSPSDGGGEAKPSSGKFDRDLTAAGKKPEPKYSERDKAPVLLLKKILDERGRVDYAQDWHITGYAVCQAMLKNGVDYDDLMASTQWAATEWDLRDNVTHFKHIRNAHAQWVNRRAVAQAQKPRHQKIMESSVAVFVLPDHEYSGYEFNPVQELEFVPSSRPGQQDFFRVKRDGTMLEAKFVHIPERHDNRWEKTA